MHMSKKNPGGNRNKGKYPSGNRNKGKCQNIQLPRMRDHAAIATAAVKCPSCNCKEPKYTACSFGLSICKQPCINHEKCITEIYCKKYIMQQKKQLKTIGTWHLLQQNRFQSRIQYVHLKSNNSYKLFSMSRKKFTVSSACSYPRQRHTDNTTPH
jgi:hypothetical protein